MIIKIYYTGPRKLSITWGTNETSIYSGIFFLRTHDSIGYLYVGGFMMNDKDLKEFYDLDKLKNYNPLPAGLIVADSGIEGQGLFTNRRFIAGTELGVSHYRIEGQLIRTPLGGFINHSNEPNCLKNQIRIKPGFDKWNLTVIEDIEEGSELTLKYTWYEPRRN